MMRYRRGCVCRATKPGLASAASHHRIPLAAPTGAPFVSMCVRAYMCGRACVRACAGACVRVRVRGVCVRGQREPSMRKRTCGVYNRFLDALAAEGVEYGPLVWSCWGGGHPDTIAALTQLAGQAARRRGFARPAHLLRQLRANVGAALARRVAAMLRACLLRACLCYVAVSAATVDAARRHGGCGVKAAAVAAMATMAAMAAMAACGAAAGVELPCGSGRSFFASVASLLPFPPP